MREAWRTPLVSTSATRSVRPRTASAAPPAVAECAERRVLLSTTAWTNLAGGDFDGDGLNETLVRINAGRGRLADLGYSGSAFRRGALLMLDEAGLFGDPLGIRARGNAAPLAAVADFNADGRLDLVLAGRRLSGVRNGLTFLAGNGDGTFSAGVNVGAAPSNVTSLEAGDVNNDGRADLVGTAQVRTARPGNGFASGRTIPVRLGDDPSGEQEWTIRREDTTDYGAHRPHAAGASAEAGGAVITGSILLPSGTGAGGFFGDSLFGDYGTDISVAPGFTPPASRVGISAEAGGARVGGFVDAFPAGGPFADTDQVFVLFGNGAGGFSTTNTTSTVD